MSQESVGSRQNIQLLVGYTPYMLYNDNAREKVKTTLKVNLIGKLCFKCLCFESEDHHHR